MKKLLIFATIAALSLGLVACKKKTTEEKKAGDDMEAMDMDAMDMEAMDMDAMDMDAMDMDAMDMDAMDARPEPDKSADALNECKKMYADHYAKFVPILAKLGITATADEIVKAYGADKPDTLKRCTDLTPEQRACAMKQPNPLESKDECKHGKFLTNYVPSDWSKKISGEDKPLDEKIAKGLQAWLTGKWVREDAKWKRKEVLIVAKDGKATGENFKDDKPDGKKEDYEFSFKNELQIHRKWNTTTQTFTFFKLGPKAFVMSSNLIYNVVPVEDKKAFNLKIGSSEVALVKDGKCEVIDLSAATAYAATCTWGKDEASKKDNFTVSYKPGKWERKSMYIHQDKHLIHQYLWDTKYLKK
ncbi:MAG: hypothetical protein RBU30_04185 [Polyangia bacterium]|jgi:hypothetical protein|nr:hypothetical protein [Polyangia bacterium]